MVEDAQQSEISPTAMGVACMIPSPSGPAAADSVYAQGGDTERMLLVAMIRPRNDPLSY